MTSTRQMVAVYHFSLMMSVVTPNTSIDHPFKSCHWSERSSPSALQRFDTRHCRSMNFHGNTEPLPRGSSLSCDFEPFVVRHNRRSMSVSSEAESKRDTEYPTARDRTLSWTLLVDCHLSILASANHNDPSRATKEAESKRDGSPFSERPISLSQDCCYSLPVRRGLVEVIQRRRRSPYFLTALQGGR